MNPSSPHDAPVMLGTSHSVTGGPPSEETFLIAPPVEKPIQRPSGEKNGADPPRQSPATDRRGSAVAISQDGTRVA
jgi:hypothetical protein